MFYEAKHSISADDLSTETGVDFKFPLHLHKAFEYITVTEGCMRIRVGANSYEITPGSSVLVFPDQPHALETVGHSRHSLTIFAPYYVKAFAGVWMEHVPESHLFRVSPALDDSIRTLDAGDSILHIKSVLYSLLDTFDKTAVYRTRVPEKEALLLRIFDYVNKNYGAECTLKSLSTALCYHYVYLSRYFSERTGISFSAYVTGCRVSESCYRLTNTGDSVTRIALECGFDSLRSFDRSFRTYTGKTPGEYRQCYAEKQSKKETDVKGPVLDAVIR